MQDSLSTLAAYTITCDGGSARRGGGRPPSAFAYPRIWRHVEDLGFVRTHHTLIQLRHRDGFKPRNGSTLSNKFFETKCKADEPVLMDYATVHDLVELVSHHRQIQGKAALRPGEEVAYFDCMIIALPNVHGDRMTEHGDALSSLASRSGFTSETIDAALQGRLLPDRVCVAIVLAAGGNPTASIRHRLPSAKNLPLRDSNCLSSVLQWLERA